METPFLEIPEEQYSLPKKWEAQDALEIFDTSYLRSLTETSEAVSPDEKYLVFTSGEQTFAISLQDVAEVCSSLPVTSLPGVPAWLSGVVNLRGDLLAVIDPEVSNTSPAKTKIIVLASQQKRSVGLLVDQVKEITQLPASSIGTSTESGKGLMSFSSGASQYRDSSVLILDTRKIFMWPELRELGE